MHALRLCALVVSSLLCFSCFLDESPAHGGSKATNTSASATTTRHPFVPREPAASTHDVQAGANAAPAQPVMSMRPGIPQATIDAGADPATPPTTPGTPVAFDAGAPPLRDAAVGRDAQSSTAQDAQAPRIRDAEVAQDAEAVMATPPQPIHRYDFSGSERVAVDRIGEANGELRGNARLTGSGEVQLGETQQDAVALPTGILNGVQELTMLGWLTVHSNVCWQRLADFFYYSEQTSPEGQITTQASRLYLTPISCPDGLPTAGYATQQSRARAQGGQALMDGRRTMMLGATYDARRQRLQLIVDGVIEAELTVQINQRQLARARARLGATVDNSHPVLNGSISEFRIYAQALDAATIREIARRGPDRL